MTTIYVLKLVERIRMIGVAENPERPVSEDQVIAILVFLRQHLESKGEKHKYPVTNSYCNWILHCELTNSFVQSKLAEIAHFLDDDADKLNDNVLELSSFKDLRSEINSIMAAEEINQRLFNSRNLWGSFVSSLLGLVFEKPIRKNANAIHKVNSLSLVLSSGLDLSEDYINSTGVRPNVPFWQIKCEPDTEYVGPMAWTERPEDFEYP